MMLDLFLKDLDLGVVEFIAGLAGHDFGDQHLGAVVLDISFLEQVLFDLALAGRIEDFFLDLGMDAELRADLRSQLLLAAGIRLATAVAEAGCPRFVGVGTNLEYRPDESGDPLKEDSALGPVHLYGACKLALSVALEEIARRHGMSVAWARTFLLYGPAEDPRRRHYLDEAAKKLPPREALLDLQATDAGGEALVHLNEREIARLALAPGRARYAVSLPEAAQTRRQNRLRVVYPKGAELQSARIARADDPTLAALRASALPMLGPGATRGVPELEQAGPSALRFVLRVPEAGLRVDAEAGRVPGRLVAGQWRFARSMLLAWLSQVEVQPTTNKSSPAMPFRIEETPEEQAAFWASIQAFRDDVNRATRSGKYAPE